MIGLPKEMNDITRAPVSALLPPAFELVTCSEDSSPITTGLPVARLSLSQFGSSPFFFFL